MSSVLHPVGPEGRGTYWRRRLVAIIALVVVVVLVALGVRALTTSDDAAAQQPDQLDPSTVASLPDPSRTPTGSPTDSPTDTPTGSPSESATQSVTQSPGGPCEPSALTLTLTSNATTYGPGQTPKFILTVRNTSAATCTAEIGSAVRAFSASTADGTQVWSSNDCQLESASQVYEIDPDATRSMSVVWSRLTSAAGCPDGQNAVENGNYTINGSWNDVAAQPVTVALTG